MGGRKELVKKRLPASERRKVILDAALRTFVEFGYHGALMETIAERADVTKPILYRHFPSKMDLLLAILDQAGEEIRQGLLEPGVKGLDWRELIKHDVHAYLSFIQSRGMAFQLLYNTDLNVDQGVYERLKGIRNSVIDITAARIASHTDMTKETPETIRIMTVMVVGMVENTAIHWLEHKDAPLEKYERILEKAVTSILAKLPPRRN